MSNENIGESTTNMEEASCKQITLECVPFWEQCQEKGILQLSLKLPSKNINEETSEYRIPGLGIKIKPDKYFVIKDYHQRARNIAAIYAKIYLESLDPQISDPNLKGRFHWMGLGAFASKTVAYLLNHPSATIGENLLDLVEEAREMLACGNFWLYMEIAPWHIAWAICPESFNMCKEDRDSRKFTTIKEKMESLEWAKDALKKINYLTLDVPKASKETDGDSQKGYVETAFEALEEIESVFMAEKKEHEKYRKAGKYLKKHLMQLAHNEQLNVLQATVWDNESVRKGAKLQRNFVLQLFSPNTSVALSSDYTIDPLRDAFHERYYDYDPMTGYPIEKVDVIRHKDIVKNLPEKPYLFDEGIKPEDPDERMVYVTRLAKTYHKLMLDIDGRAFLHKEIGIIASWHHLK